MIIIVPYIFVLSTNYLCEEKINAKLIPSRKAIKEFTSPEIELRLTNVAVYSGHPSQGHEVNMMGDKIVTVDFIEKADVWLSCEYTISHNYGVSVQHKVRKKTCVYEPEGVNVLCR